MTRFSKWLSFFAGLLHTLRTTCFLLMLSNGERSWPEIEASIYSASPDAHCTARCRCRFLSRHIMLVQDISWKFSGVSGRIFHGSSAAITCLVVAWTCCCCRLVRRKFRLCDCRLCGKQTFFLIPLVFFAVSPEHSAHFELCFTTPVWGWWALVRC